MCHESVSVNCNYVEALQIVFNELIFVSNLNNSRDQLVINLSDQLDSFISVFILIRKKYLKLPTILFRTFVFCLSR